MRTEIVNGRLLVSDNPTLFWLFYSFFIMRGSTACISPCLLPLRISRNLSEDRE